MAIGKSPAFQFYPADFISDGRVAAMSLQERGAYITLLCICWNEQSLPKDTRRLANICGIPHVVLRRLWPAISICFREENGVLVHPRLELERQKQAEFQRRQSDKGLKGGRPRKPEESRGFSKTKPDESRRPAEIKPDESSSIFSLQSSSSSKESTYDLAFERFQEAYPANRRQGGALVESMFLKAIESTTLDTILAAIEQQKRSEQWQNPNLIPSMTNWLHQQRWLQVLPEPQGFGSTPQTVGNAAALQRFAAKGAV